MPFSCTNGDMCRCLSNKKTTPAPRTRKTWKCSGRPFNGTGPLCPGKHLSFPFPVPHSFAHSSVYPFTYSLIQSLIHFIIFLCSFISLVQSLVNSFFLFKFYSVWSFLFSCLSETELLAKSSVNPQQNFESFIDLCQDNPRKNGGTHNWGSERLNCSCRWGFSGNDCSTEGNVELRFHFHNCSLNVHWKFFIYERLPWFHVYYRVSWTSGYAEWWYRRLADYCTTLSWLQV